MRSYKFVNGNLESCQNFESKSLLEMDVNIILLHYIFLIVS
jgi:hypothetical protein